MKILTTQLTGVLQRISAQEEALEMTARILAQATSSNGTIYVAAFNSMEAVLKHALLGKEPFKNMKAWTDDIELHSNDRVWILTENSTDERALQVAQKVNDQFLSLATIVGDKGASTELANMSDAFVALGIEKGILPNEQGERVVTPIALAALYAYEIVKFEHDEMFASY